MYPGFVSRRDGFGSFGKQPECPKLGAIPVLQGSRAVLSRMVSSLIEPISRANKLLNKLLFVSTLLETLLGDTITVPFSQPSYSQLSYAYVLCM